VGSYIVRPGSRGDGALIRDIRETRVRGADAFGHFSLKAKRGDMVQQYPNTKQPCVGRSGMAAGAARSAGGTVQNSRPKAQDASANKKEKKCVG